MVNTEKYSKYIENNYKQEFLEKKKSVVSNPEIWRYETDILPITHFNYIFMHVCIRFWVLSTFALPYLLPAPFNPLFSPQV